MTNTISFLGAGRVGARVALATSLSLLALAAHQAAAQALPVGCVSNGADPGIAAEGDTVSCLSDVVGGLALEQDAVTVRVGNAETAVTIADGETGVALSGGGGVQTVETKTQSLRVSNSASVISGTQDGITATGAQVYRDILIVTEGETIGTLGDGIRTTHTGLGTTSITAAGVTAGQDGIEANLENFNQTAEITANGTITADGRGIAVLAPYSGTSLTVTAEGDVNATGDAVYLLNPNSPLTRLTGSGNLSSTNGRGIMMDVNSGSTEIVHSGGISVAETGIYLDKLGGTMLVTQTGGVTSRNGTGIDLEAGYNVDGLTVTTGAVSAAADGIALTDRRDGAAASAASTLTTTGPILAGNHGIEMTLSEDTAPIVAIGGDITAGNRGVAVTNTSSQGLTMQIGAGATVYGVERGVAMNNYSFGAVDLTAAGDLASDFRALSLVTTYGALNVAMGAAQGNVRLAAQDGSFLTDYATSYEAINLTASGQIEGNVEVLQFMNGAVDVHLAEVVSADFGVKVTNNDAVGDTTVRTGAISAQGGTGLQVTANYGATSATVETAGAITGTALGAELQLYGTETNLVTLGHSVTGQSAEGLNLFSYGATTLTANGAIEGATNGAYIGASSGLDQVATLNSSVLGNGGHGVELFLRSYGGAVALTANGPVTGTDGGLSGNVGGVTGTTVTLNKAVAGGTDGLDLDTVYTAGAIALQTADVTGQTGDGIDLLTYADNTTADVTTTGVVAGAQRGIAVEHWGSDTLSIIAQQAVSGGTGIEAVSAFSGAGIEVAAADVTGSAGAGITAYGDGAGDIGITTTGAVSGATDGITAETLGGRVTVDIQGGSVSGAAAGVRLLSAGDVTNAGAISGGANGVLADADLVLTNAMGGDIRADAGAGVVTGAGARITNAGTIAGVDFSTGSERLTLTTTGILEGLVDFGANDDLLTFDGIMAELVGSSSTLADYTGLSMAEAVAVGLPLFYGGAGTDTIAFDAGVSVAGLVSRQRLGTWADEGVYGLTFRNGDSSQSTLVYAGFEVFSIDGQHLSESDLPALPLPGSLPLLLAGLGGLRLLLRRRS